MITTTWEAFPSLDRVFDEAIRSTRRGRAEGPSFPIAADVREKSDEYTLELDVPGVKLEDLEITLMNRELTIRGARRFEAGRDEKVTRGRPYGPFAVTFTLPQSVEGDALTAGLAEGVLSIHVPKQPKAKPRKVPIESGVERKSLSE
jgi:HSP20 family protein